MCDTGAPLQVYSKPRFARTSLKTQCTVCTAHVRHTSCKLIFKQCNNVGALHSFYHSKELGPLSGANKRLMTEQPLGLKGSNQTTTSAISNIGTWTSAYRNVHEGTAVLLPCLHVLAATVVKPEQHCCSCMGCRSLSRCLAQAPAACLLSKQALNSTLLSLSKQLKPSIMYHVHMDAVHGTLYRAAGLLPASSLFAPEQLAVGAA